MSNTAQGQLEFRHLVDLDAVRAAIREDERARLALAQGQAVEALSDKQKLFVEEYLRDLNATQAAIRAGYSKHTAGAQAHKLLQNAEIARLIAEGQQKRLRAAQLQASSVLNELRKLAFSDLRQVIGPEGAVLPVEQWPDEIAACVQSLEVEELWEGRGEARRQIGVTKKVKLHNKLDALRMLAQHFKLLVDAARRDIDAQDADWHEMTDE